MKIRVNAKLMRVSYGKGVFNIEPGVYDYLLDISSRVLDVDLSKNMLIDEALNDPYTLPFDEKGFRAAVNVEKAKLNIGDVLTVSLFVNKYQFISKLAANKGTEIIGVKFTVLNLAQSG